MVSNKKKSTVMSPIRRRMKKRNPSSGQNGQLVHWWLLIHSGHVQGLTFGSSQIYIDQEAIKVKGPYSYILMCCLLALRKTEEYVEQNLP